MTAKLNKCLNIGDLQGLSERRLPDPIYNYLVGGADDEYSLGNNTSAFDRYQLVPNCLVDVSEIDTRTRVLGKLVDSPLVLAPTGMSRMFHPAGEEAVARAAQKFGIYYALSTYATTDIESVAAASDGPKMYQVYVMSDRTLNDELIDRCKAANYDALCLTVDTVVGGNRERDLRTGFAQLPKLTRSTLLSMMKRPRWCWDQLNGDGLELANLPCSHGLKGDGLAKYLTGLLERKLTWQHAERMIARWDGEFAIKGVMSVDDARRAVDIGATSIIISNHGGRQMDGVPAPIEMVADIADAVGGRASVIVDGGIRRGSHVMKALAMGASACMIGRPYLYGLAAGGQAGVERALELLNDELVRGMTLLGCCSIADIQNANIRVV
jgi:L-lactate dehydrogenase (cytochrome)